MLEVISRELQQSYALPEESAAFWMPGTIDDIVQTQAAPVVTDIGSLAVDFWPEDESADEFNQFIAEQRHADRMRDV